MFIFPPLFFLFLKKRRTNTHLNLCAHTSWEAHLNFFFDILRAPTITHNGQVIRCKGSVGALGVRVRLFARSGSSFLKGKGFYLKREKKQEALLICILPGPSISDMDP